MKDRIRIAPIAIADVAHPDLQAVGGTAYRAHLGTHLECLDVVVTDDTIAASFGEYAVQGSYIAGDSLEQNVLRMATMAG